MQVGNWIQYSTHQDFSKWEPEDQEIYQKNQFFLVITENNPTFDDNFDLIDVIAEKIHNHCERMCMLGLVDLASDYRIAIASKETVESVHGVDTVLSVYEAAQKYIERTKDSSALLSRKKVLSKPKFSSSIKQEIATK